MTTTLTLKGALCIAPRGDAEPQPTLAQSAGDLLINSILGFMLTALASFYGTPTLVHTLASGKASLATGQFRQIEVAQINYYVDHGSWAQTIAALVPTYIPIAPVDPQTAVGGASTYSITPATVNNTDSYVIMNTQVHDSHTLAALKKYVAAGTPPTTDCGDTGCTQMVYDPMIGMEGQ